MNVKITGKELKATEAIKEYVEKKLERLEKYFGEDFDVVATIRAEKNMQIAELHVNAKGTTYRAVTEHKDLYASIDKDIDILEGQIRKMKTKKEKLNRDATIKILENNTNEPVLEDEVIKTLYYSIKPMSVEDAVLKLKENPTHNFYTFINVDTSKVNVLYKLKDSKNYGLIEPEA